MSKLHSAFISVLFSIACSERAFPTEEPEPEPCPSNASCIGPLYVDACQQPLRCGSRGCDPYAPPSPETDSPAWVEGVCGEYWVRQYVGDREVTLVWDARTKELVGRRTRTAYRNIECVIDGGVSDVLIEGTVPNDCTLFGVPLDRDARSDAGTSH